MRSSEIHPAHRAHRIAIVYDNTIRPDTTGEYCRRALESLGVVVSHFQPTEAEAIPPIYDLYLRVDDDLEYSLPETLHPLVYWAIDTHRDFPSRLSRARAADFVFCAQRNGAARLRADGIPSALWLPLACDPELHRRIPGVAKQYDICFVGNTFPGDGERSRLVQWIRASSSRAFVGRAYGEEMARIYSASRLVFNCAIRDDVNMRVFEAAACGSLLLTNDLAENGQNLLFSPGTHFVTYRDTQELHAVIQRYLRDEREREQIADTGMRHAHAHHTYRQRMADLLAVVCEDADLAAKYPIASRVPQESGDRAIWHLGGNGSGMLGHDATVESRVPEPPMPESQPTVLDSGSQAPRETASGQPKASIIIPTCNHLALTQQCVASLRASTDVLYEIIIVDNASGDGTAAWARGEGLRIIVNPKNFGFARACNQGMLAAVGEYIVLLNNDTLVSPGWLSGLVRHAEADPMLGLIGPSTNFAGSRQQVRVSYTSREEFLAFSEQVAQEYAGQAQPVNRLAGVCLLIPRRVMLRIGLLDERFGMGLFEDDDYCLRARMAGYRLLWARDVFVHHEGHATFRGLTEENEYRRRLAANERLLRDKWNLARYMQPWEEETGLVARLQNGKAGAWDLLRGGQFPEAYDAFEQLVRANPTDARAMVGLGLSAEGRGAPAAARMAYETVLRLAPEDPDARRGLARIRGDGAALRVPVEEPGVPG